MRQGRSTSRIEKPIELDRLAFVGDGAIIASVPTVGDAAVFVSHRIFRIELNCLRVVGDGDISLTLFIVGRAAVCCRPLPILDRALIAWVSSAMARSSSPLFR